MDPIKLSPRKKRRTILPLAMIIAAVALTLAIFPRMGDEIRGKPEFTDPLAFTAVFVVAGCYVGWLPEIWDRTDGTVFEGLVMPAYITLFVLYLYFVLRIAFVQPAATTVGVLPQLFVMICLSSRTR